MKKLIYLNVLIIICCLVTLNASGQCEPVIIHPVMQFPAGGSTAYQSISFNGCERPGGATVTFSNVPAGLTINYSFNSNTSILLTATWGANTSGFRNAEINCFIPQLNKTVKLFVYQPYLYQNQNDLCTPNSYAYGYSTYYTNYLNLLNDDGSIYLQYPTYTGTNCTTSNAVFYNVPDWLQVSTSYGPSGPGIAINYKRNGTLYPREAHIVLYKDNTYMAIPIKQPKCNENWAWYPDADGDGYGDYLAQATISCTPPFPNAVGNNLDKCPNTYSLSNSGCESYYQSISINSNWISTKTKDITGAIKSHSISYFNDLAKNIQNQTVDFKTNRTWISQTLYDSQGRPALNTLSAPTSTYSGTFNYSTDFMEDAQNGFYSNYDFEYAPESPGPVGNESNSLGWYYSINNTNETYQDITSYPFSRTIYSELNPGAALKTIGGNKVDTNNDNIPDSWLQGYTFSMPAGQELSQSVAFNDPNYSVTNSRKIIKTINKDVHNNEVVIFTDTDGKTLAAARTGAGTPRTTTIDISRQGFVDVHVPVNTAGFTIQGVSGITTKVYNLITEQTTTAATGGLPAGFYRVSITNLESYNPISSNTTVHINCKENYYDYSLNEYDDAGRLTASYQPVGVTKAQKPVSIYAYNALGQLLSTTSPDEGTANFKYRKDGQIRFSQNSKQLANTEFSYTNYDNLGRPIESGVFDEGSVTFANSDSIVNNIDNPATPNIDEDGLPNTSCTERQFTRYDYLESTDLTFLNLFQSSYANPTFLSGNVAKTSNGVPIANSPLTDNTSTYYSYDVYGRVKWIVQNINGLGTKTIDYDYDPVTGAVTQVDYQKNIPSERFRHRYTYDPIDNSLVKVETSANGGSTYTLHADYKYYETGALKQVEIAKLNGIALQTIDYVYNLNGQLKAINPEDDAADLFSMQIDYHTNDYARSVSNISTPDYGQDQFNGNIKGVRWNNKTLENADKNYSYYYNKNNWLTDALYDQYTNTEVDVIDSGIYDGTTTTIKATNSITLVPGFHAKSGATLSAKIVTDATSTNQSGDYNVTGITYDANGNIKSLKRNKDGGIGNNAMDNLSYVYDTTKPNQLKRVDDAAGDVAGADDIGDQDGDNYKYNSIGQLIEDWEYVTPAEPNNIIRYAYNSSGLVTEVSKKNVPLVKFFYNDKGHRVKKQSFDTSGSLTGTQYYVRDVAGTTLAIYDGTTPKEYPIYGANRLGVYNRVSDHSVYQLTDHLGNVRAVVERAGSAAVALVATDYYPFGMPMPNRNVEGNYRYKYQGQEKDPETGMEAFELRLWDARIGRWLTTDPMGEFHSPYLGMGNNPISKIDPTGGSTQDPPDGNGFSDGFNWTDSDGSWNWNAESGVWEGLGISDDIFGTTQSLNGITVIGTQKGFLAKAWDSDSRRYATGDMFQISLGWDANVFLGGGTTLEFNWLLTGKDASFFPYIGYSAHGSVGDGGNISVDLGFNRANHSGSVNDVTAASLPGWEFGASVGGKIIVGADVGYSYSKDGDTGYGWHQINTSVGVGLELSPLSAANIQLQGEYNFVQFHTGTGKWYFND